MNVIKCSNTYTNQCNFPKYKKYDECILHCSKEELSSLQNPYFKDYHKFFEQLIGYILENEKKLNKQDYFTDYNLFDYFTLPNEKFEILKESANLDEEKKSSKKFLLHNISDELVSIYNYFKNRKIVFSKIHFPNTDEIDTPNYENILKRLFKIDFNYCSFYITSLELKNVECEFRDCEFYEYWSLKNFKVPQELEEQEVYNACVFHEDVSASGGEKDKFILDNVQFNGCTFEKELTFENVISKKPIFKDWKGFESKIKTLKVDSSSFESRFILNNYAIENVLFTNNIFSGKFEFTNNSILDMNIDNCNFEKLAEFYSSKFSKFKIFKSIFNDYTGFEKCEFGEDKNTEDSLLSNFQYVTFLSFINFRNTHFKSGLLFEDTNLKESPNFLNSKINFDNTSKETFRIIKHSFDKLGNHIEANKYFSLEMKKYKEDIFKVSGWTQEKTIFWLNGLASNYGQSYWKGIKWLLLVSLIYAIIVCLFNCNVYKNGLVLDLLNGWSKAILPFGRFLPKNLEFITLISTVIQSALIWHIVVALKRHTKR